MTDFMMKYRKVKKYLDESSHLIIYGDIGTGKTMVVSNYLKNYNYSIMYYDKENDRISVFSTSRDILNRKKVIIYDDSTILSAMLKKLSKINNCKIIVVINKIPKNIPKNFYKIEINYPSSDEIELYLEYKKIDKKMIIKFINSGIKDLRKIEMFVQDLFIEEPEIKKKRNLFDLSPELISYNITENIARLSKHIDINKLIKIDKIKNIDGNLYKSFLISNIPNIKKKRLRFPSKIIQIAKGVKNG